MDHIPFLHDRLGSPASASLQEAYRQSEQRFQLAFEHAPIGMALVAPDGRWLHVNHATCRMLGYSRDEMLQRTFQDVTYGEDLSPDLSLLNRLLKGEIPGYELEKRYVRKDGALVWVYLTVSLVRDEAGHPLYAVSQILDITERKEAEKREARYRALIEKSYDAIDLLAADGTILYASPSVYRITGRTPEELIGRPAFEWLHPDDLARANESLEDFVRQPGATVTAQQRFLHADGSWRWVESTTTNLLHDPTVGAIVSNFHDVTDRRQSEEALRQTHALLQAVSEGTTDAVFVKDREGRYLLINSSGARFIGRPIEDILGRTDLELFPPETARQLLEGDRRILESGIMQICEERLETALGRRIFQANKGPYRDAEGQIIGLIGISRDVTAEKMAEEAVQEWKDRYEQAARSSNRILYDWNAQTDETLFGGAIESILGYAQEEVKGELSQWLERIHPEDVEAVRREVREHVAAKRPFRMEYRVRRKDDTYIHVQDEGHCRFDAQGNVTGVVGFVADITRQRLLENQLRQAQKMEAVGQLAGGVAHDFNNLLTIITGYSELLLQTLSGSDPMRSIIEEIRKAGERSAALTRQLLAFSRRQMLTPKVLDLNEVIEGMGKLLRRTLGEDIELSTVLASQLGLVRADPGQIEQVLLNLAVNARDAMPQGGKLTIETRNVTLDETFAQLHGALAPGDYVMLAVSDTGAGMPEEVRRHIFEPFFTTKEVGKGTGLGLAVVHGIISQSGGHIAVYSEPGQGSTFKVLLPRIHQKVASEEDTPQSAALPRGSEAILLVEDEDNVRAIARHILTSCGYQVLEAANGQEAIKVLETHPDSLHLLVTDVVMPAMGGRALVENVVAARPEIKVLYLSGYTDDAIVRHGILHEKVNFLQKPFTPRALAQKVRAVLDA